MFEGIKDKNGKLLSADEAREYEDDVWDVGIPGSAAGFYMLWDKWGERLGIAKPVGYDEWDKARKSVKK